jgi:hypothetical protein
MFNTAGLIGEERMAMSNSSARQVSGSRWLAFALILFSIAMPATASDVDGFQYPASEVLDSLRLELNGVTQTKDFSVGLYVPERRNTPEALAKLPGPKRVRMVAQREIQTEALGRVLVERLRANASKEEITENFLRIARIGMIFSDLPPLDRGDVLSIDWTERRAATEFWLNGRRVGDPIPGAALFPMLLKVWVGDKAPADMRRALLGQGEPLAPAGR